MRGQPLLEQLAVVALRGLADLVDLVLGALAPGGVHVLDDRAGSESKGTALPSGGDDLVVDVPVPVSLVAHGPGAVPAGAELVDVLAAHQHVGGVLAADHPRVA